MITRETWTSVKLYILYYLFIHGKILNKKKLIKTTLFYKIAVWEPDWQLL